MTVAQGIKKTTAFVKQSALGTTGSTGSQLLRRVTFIPTAERDTYTNNEIASHEQSTGITYGIKKASAKYSGILSPETFDLAFANILRKDFAAVSAYTASTIAAVADTGFTDSASGFLTAHFKVGDIVRVTGFTATANNSKNFLVTALTAGTMTGIFLNGDDITAESASNDISITVVGKKCLAPLTGHTNDYFTFEDWYGDISKSEVFSDCQFGKADIKLPATGNATIDIDITGLARSRGGTQILTSPTAETTTAVLTAVNGVVYVNGSAAANITSAQITIDGTITPGEAVLGSNSVSDIQKGRIVVTGTFSGLFSDTTIQDFYDAETPVGLIIVVADQIASATGDFVAFTLGRIKITGDAPDDGEKQITRTYPFTAEINSEGGSALAWDETIITIQDSAAA